MMSGIWKAAVVLIALAAIGCGGGALERYPPVDRTPPIRSTPNRAATVQAHESAVAARNQRKTDQTAPSISSKALGQMEIAFEGQPSKERIKRQVDTAMRMYSVPITEENYSRAGSVLVALSNEYGPSEMDILDYMIRSHVPGVNITFPNAAGLSVAFLSAGDR